MDIHFEVAVLTQHTKQITDSDTDAIASEKNLDQLAAVSRISQDGTVEHSHPSPYMSMFESGVPPPPLWQVSHGPHDKMPTKLMPSSMHAMMQSNISHFLYTSDTEMCSGASDFYLSGQESYVCGDTVLPIAPSGEMYYSLTELSPDDTAAGIVGPIDRGDDSLVACIQNKAEPNILDSFIEQLNGHVSEGNEGSNCSDNGKTSEDDDFVYKNDKKSDSQAPSEVDTEDCFSLYGSLEHNGNHYGEENIDGISDHLDKYSRRGSVCSSGIISRSSSQSDDIESEENFADGELSSELTQFSAQRRHRLRQKKTLNQLSTIFSPVVTSFTNTQKHSISESETVNVGNSTMVQDSPTGVNSETDIGLSSEHAVTETCKRSNFTLDEISSCGYSTESSGLNPLSKPFIPRAMQGKRYQSGNISAGNMPQVTNLDGHGFLDVTCNDSGLANLTNLTFDQSSIGPVNRLASQTVEESAFFSGQNTTYEQSFIDKETAPVCQLTQGNSNEIHFERSPYKCLLNHSDEFRRLRDFSINDLPIDCQKVSVWKTIYSVSQRVVRLCVTKCTNTVNDSGFFSETNTFFSSRSGIDEVFQHYGTGFVYLIDKDFIEVRTHNKVVSKPEEAEKTVVTFSLWLPEEGKQVKVSCSGLREGFYNNIYSQSCTFKCKTPLALLQYLNKFSDIPVYRQCSNFVDSTYFSDLSPNSSLDLSRVYTCDEKSQINILLPSRTLSPKISSPPWLENQPGPCEDNLYQVNSLNLPESIKCDNEFNDYIDELIEDLSDKSEPETLHKENPFEYCGIDEIQVKTAFESAPSFDLKIETKPKSPESPLRRWPTLVSNLDQASEVISPLKIMEKRKSKLEAGNCPYSGKTLFKDCSEYKLFSSYAGDVIMSSLPKFPTLPGVSPFAHLPDYGDRWEYEGLVHVQTHHREAYMEMQNNPSDTMENQVHDKSKDKVDGNTDYDTDMTSENISHNAFREQNLKVNLKKHSNGNNDDEQMLEEIPKREQQLEEIPKREQQLEELPKREQQLEIIPDGEHCEEIPYAEQHSEERPSVEMVICRPDVNEHSEEFLDRHNAVTFGSSYSDDEQASEFKFGLNFPITDFQDYFNSCERNILNSDNLSMLPEYGHLETVIDNLVMEKATSRCRVSCQCCSKSDKRDVYAVIISFPHGGEKVVSSGQFSSHKHVGGELYDTPTCVGSCGAPIIVIREGGRLAYTSQLIHAGTSKVNDVTVGVGISYFDDALTMNDQTINLCKQ